MLTPPDPIGLLELVELHRGELLVAALAHTVDQRRGAHTLLLGAKVLVELEELGIDRR